MTVAEKIIALIESLTEFESDIVKMLKGKNEKSH